MPLVVGATAVIRHASKPRDRGQPCQRPDSRFIHGSELGHVGQKSLSCDIDEAGDAQQYLAPADQNGIIRHDCFNRGVQGYHLCLDLTQAMAGVTLADLVYVPNAERHALQRLTRQRERLEDEVTAIKRRLLDLIRWTCPAIEAVLPDLRTNLSLAILHDLFDPTVVTKTRRVVPQRVV